MNTASIWMKTWGILRMDFAVDLIKGKSVYAVFDTKTITFQCECGFHSSHNLTIHNHMEILKYCPNCGRKCVDIEDLLEEAGVETGRENPEEDPLAYPVRIFKETLGSNLLSEFLDRTKKKNRKAKITVKIGIGGRKPTKAKTFVWDMTEIFKNDLKVPKEDSTFKLMESDHRLRVYHISCGECGFIGKLRTRRVFKKFINCPACGKRTRNTANNN